MGWGGVSRLSSGVRVNLIMRIKKTRARAGRYFLTRGVPSHPSTMRGRFANEFRTPIIIYLTKTKLFSTLQLKTLIKNFIYSLPDFCGACLVSTPWSFNRTSTRCQVLLFSPRMFHTSSRLLGCVTYAASVALQHRPTPSLPSTALRGTVTCVVQCVHAHARFGFCSLP